mmetsp:Transcript_71215/g.126856  ORF Transcript_71215/g.126856 Transcript_71215/m.126856 type:complete len:547 (+) Transcript_71215:79-1719(+)
MAPPVHYLRPGEQADIHAWLVQKLQEERREVLLTLEDKHKQLLEQFLVRANQGEGVPSTIYPSARRPNTPREDGSQGKPNVPIIPMLPVAVEETDPLQDRYKQDEVEENNGSMSESKVDVEEREKTDQSKTPDTQLSTRASSSSLAPPEKVPFDHTPFGNAFEWFFGMSIFANALVMAINQQYRGLQRGYNLSYPWYQSTRQEAWPGGELTFDIFEIFFTILFTIEFISRWVIFRLHYLKEVWCYIDGAIVALAWVIVLDRQAIDFNPTFVRLVRVTKIMRLVRLLRSNQMFDCLKLLVSAINASFNILFWSLCVLVLIISVGSLFMVQMLEGYLDEPSLDDPQKLQQQRQVFKYFGTFWRSLLTMFEITFANWVPSCRTLVENVAESYGMFYLLYRCVVGLAVLMVVQAVFIQQTMKATQLDDEALAKQKRRAKAKLLKRLENVFRRLDNTGDGTLDKSEFEEALKQEEMVSMLEVFELEVSDIDVLFKLLDDGDGSISVDEFVAGVEHMKGGARAIDVMEVKWDIKKLKENLMEKRGTPMRSPR